MDTQNTKQDVLKSELKFHALLNDDQIDSVIEAIEKEVVAQEHVQELLDSTTLDKQDKCNALIEHVIAPFNMSKFNSDVKQKLEGGEVQYVVVEGDEETPPFVYTVGGLDKVGAEYFYIGDFDGHHLAGFLAGLLENDAEGTVPTTEFRYRILEVPLYKLTDDYLKMVALHYPDNRLHAPVYVIELGDDSDILPGEEGYDTTLLQFSNISDLEYTVIRESESTSTPFIHDVRSIEGVAGTAKTLGLVHLMLNELTEDPSKKAILVLNEEKWVDVLHYVKNRLNVDFEKLKERLDVYEFTNFDGQPDDLWETALKHAGELENGHLYIANLNTFLYQVNPDTKTVRGKNRKKFGELVAQAATLLPVTFSFHTLYPYKDEECGDDWFQKNPPCIPEPTHRLKTEVVSMDRYINERSCPIIEFKPIST